MKDYMPGLDNLKVRIWYLGFGAEGLIWNCDPITADSCEDFNSPGNTDVNALAVGARVKEIIGAGSSWREEF